MPSLTFICFQVLSVVTIFRIFTKKGKSYMSFWSPEGNQMFRESDEARHNDGRSLHTQLNDLLSITVEFNSVVYINNPKADSIKILTKFEETANYALNHLSTASSIQEKHQRYEIKSMDGALYLLCCCLNTINDFLKTTRSSNLTLPKYLNGSEGRHFSLSIW